MSKHDPSKQGLPDPPRNGSDPLSSTCTGSLSALVKGTEFFALLKVLRSTAAHAGVQRPASPTGWPLGSGPKSSNPVP